jgi:predicted Rossmann fold nucleotide-binding protein DprA/Smf involved in DNA uptake
MKDNNKTIDIIKQKKTVPDSLKERRKENTKKEKTILQSLESGPKTIPEIAKETKMASDVVVYSLMTLRKYGRVETDELDDSDEYYSYKLPDK